MLKALNRLTFAMSACVAPFCMGCSTAWHSDPNDILPLIASAPQNQTVIATQDAVFSVAVNGSGSYSYQWFKDGELIDGSNGPTYKVSSASLAESGIQLSVAVTDDAGTIKSSPATLTVMPLSPNLTVTPIPNTLYATTPMPLFANSQSPAPITYSVVSGPASLNGSSLSLTGVGTVTVAANQAATGNYVAAISTATFTVEQNVMVSPITPAAETIAPGPVFFAASAIGGTTNKLTWTSTGGTFIENEWMSPNTAGTYTITAQSADDPSRSSTTTATVSAPVITQQPASSALCAAGNTQLMVSSDYGQGYQWYLNGNVIRNALSRSYVISSANSALDEGIYTVNIWNAAGTVTSTPAIVTVGSTFTTNPANVSVSTGQTAIFSVAVSGSAPFIYQWYRTSPSNNSATSISGAIAAAYTTPATTDAMDGSKFYAVVTDGCGASLTSSTATLSVAPIAAPPTINQQPANTHIVIGGAASFAVQASGSPTLLYQWYRIAAGSNGAGVSISGATAAAYAVPFTAETLSNDQDRYYVTVTNNYGTAASMPATLSVGGGIVVDQQPASQSVASGQPATFSVTATSDLPLSYQWYSAAPGSSTFTPLSGAMSATYATPATIQSQTGESFYVVVSNGVTASVQSRSASLFVDESSGSLACNWSVGGNAIALPGCAYRLTDGNENEAGSLVLPNLVPTSDLSLSFTCTISNTSDIPADGFAITLGDPAAGATPASTGMFGIGLGAWGIPGVVIAFDDYYNEPGYIQGFPGDPQVPYVGVTRGETDLFEAPYYMENSSIPPLAAYGQSISHDYLITVSNGLITVMMDGNQVISGNIQVPDAAYLFVTAGTGDKWEQVDITNFKVTSML